MDSGTMTSPRDAGTGAPLDGTTGRDGGTGSEPDATMGPPAPDAAAPADAHIDVTPAPPGLAGFAFVVDGQVQVPLSCPAEDWEFAPSAAQGGTVCNGGTPPCPGLTVLIVNTGTLPMPYTVETLWDTSGGADGYPPGVNFGDSNELSGVLAPGASVDISSVYVGGITAVLGSAEPFSNPDAGKYVADEGTIPWPAGVAGSGGATTMYVAEIEILTSCMHPTDVW
jgi:hypothetical protein